MKHTVSSQNGQPLDILIKNKYNFDYLRSKGSKGKAKGDNTDQPPHHPRPKGEDDAKPKKKRKRN